MTERKQQTARIRTQSRPSSDRPWPSPASSPIKTCCDVLDAREDENVTPDAGAPFDRCANWAVTALNSSQREHLPRQRTFLAVLRHSFCVVPTTKPGKTESLTHLCCDCSHRFRYSVVAPVASVSVPAIFFCTVRCTSPVLILLLNKHAGTHDDQQVDHPSKRVALRTAQVSEGKEPIPLNVSWTRRVS